MNAIEENGCFNLPADAEQTYNTLVNSCDEHEQNYWRTQIAKGAGIPLKKVQRNDEDRVAASQKSYQKVKEKRYQRRT